MLVRRSLRKRKHKLQVKKQLIPHQVQIFCQYGDTSECRVALISGLLPKRETGTASQTFEPILGE